jgi:hypothetical protein
MATSTSTQVRQLSVYDPALCCSTGVCGPGVDPALATAAADFAWIESAGVKVERFNLSQEPQAFAANEKVLTIMREAGDDALPVVLLDGELLTKSRYPSRDELAELLGIGESADLPADTSVEAEGCGCETDSSCC